NIYKSEKNIRSAKVDEISSQFYPQIYTSLAYTRLSDIPPFSVKVPFSPTPLKIQDAFLNYYVVNAGFTLPIFMGFKLTSLKEAALLQAKASEKEADAETNNEAMRITEAFYNLLKIEKQYNLVEQSLTSMKNHLNDAERKYEQGMIKKSDVLKIKVEKQKLESSLIEMKNNVEVARTFFNRAIGIDLRTDSKIEWQPEKIEIEMSLNELLAEARANRDELKSIELQSNAAAENLRSEKSGYYPTLNAYGNYYYNNPNQRYLPLEDKFQDNWELGVAVKWNIFDWGKTSAKVTQAEETLTKIRNKESLLKESIETEVINNYLKLKSAQSKIEAAEISVESAKENLNVVENLFNQKMATSTELTDAETNLLKAETDLINAKINAELIYKQLMKSIGRRIY
ncbi:MAG: TolC family protein, partial [Bacteroidetes bacterium]